MLRAIGGYIRQHHVALLALFVALGGTALALGRNEVKSKHIAPNAARGVDIEEKTLSGNVRKLIYNAPGTSSAPLTKIAKVGPYTIKGQCTLDFTDVRFDLWVRGPAGTADWMQGRAVNDVPGSLGAPSSKSVGIPANVDTEILSSGETDEPDYRRIGGTAMLRSGSKLVEVEYNAVADARVASKSCFLYGAATNAT